MLNWTSSGHILGCSMADICQSPWKYYDNAFSIIIPNSNGPSARFYANDTIADHDSMRGWRGKVLLSFSPKICHIWLQPILVILRRNCIVAPEALSPTYGYHILAWWQLPLRIAYGSTDANEDGTNEMEFAKASIHMTDYTDATLENQLQFIP